MSEIEYWKDYLAYAKKRLTELEADLKATQQGIENVKETIKKTEEYVAKLEKING